MHASITEQTIKLINSLEEKGDLEAKLKKLIYNELIRRLNRYQLTNQHLSRKYKMSFPSFKKKNIVKKKGYSFEAEQDLWDWEMALDGIGTMKKKIKALAR